MLPLCGNLCWSVLRDNRLLKRDPTDECLPQHIGDFQLSSFWQASTVSMDARASWRHAQTLLSFVSFFNFSNQSVRTTKFWTVLTETLITEQGWNVTTISSEDGTVSPEQRWLPNRFNSKFGLVKWRRSICCRRNGD